MDISRRTAVVGGLAATLGAATLVAGRARAQVEPPVDPTLDDFVAASARLLGAAPGDLDRDVAATILAGMLTVGLGPGIVALADDGAIDTGEVADDIVAAWTSGVVTTASGPVVATFADARLWTALDYTKPFALCGGETGYWAGPPDG